MDGDVVGKVCVLVLIEVVEVYCSTTHYNPVGNLNGGHARRVKFGVLAVEGHGEDRVHVVSVCYFEVAFGV